MQIEYVKKAIVFGWVLALVAVATYLKLDSVIGWAALLGVGLPPPLVMWRMWNPPAESMSESIRGVLR